MKRHVRTALALGCALVLTVGGCGRLTGKNDEAANGGPPAGGWPQPADGKITDKMCGLLTSADYKKQGHNLLLELEAHPLQSSANGISCESPPATGLSLDLQPNAESGKLAYTADLEAHKERMTKENKKSILAENVVNGADESWFDVWGYATDGGPYTEHELRARRGALVVTLTLSSSKESKKDPREVLSALAALVLERIPDVGRTDTGPTLSVTFTATGTGTAKKVDFLDPASGKQRTEQNVKLPWTVTVPMPTRGKQMISLSFNVTGSGEFTQPIGCSIAAGGKTLDQKPAKGGGFAFCLASYTQS